MILPRLMAAAGLLLAARLPAAAAGAAVANHDLARIPFNAGFLFVVAVILAIMSARYPSLDGDQAARIGMRLKFIVGLPLIWTALAFVHAETGFPRSEWIAWPLFLAALGLFLGYGQYLLPRFLRRWLAAGFPDETPTTHGSAQFGSAATGAHHLAPAAPADAFVLGILPNVPRKRDARFRQDGHILTCAPTGAGKGLGGVIPNLLDYPGSAFVLDLKGENFAVTARARRRLGQRVILIDPFGITGAPAQALNWLDTLYPNSPDVVSRAAGLADMLVAVEGTETELALDRDRPRVVARPADLCRRAALGSAHDGGAAAHRHQPGRRIRRCAGAHAG